MNLGDFDCGGLGGGRDDCGDPSITFLSLKKYI